MSTKLIIGVCGDSIAGPAGRWPYQTFGVTSVGDASAPASMAAQIYYSSRMMLRNMAIAGTRLALNPNNVGVIRPTYIDIIYARKQFARPGASPRKYLYINAIGTNDGAIGGLASVAAYAAAVAVDIVAAKTAGADYGWICSLLPRADGGASLTEVNRLAYNALVTNASWRASNGVDDCIDLASATHADPSFLPLNSGGDTTWFNADNIHPQDVLSSEMAVIALAKLNALLATIP